MNSTSSRNTPWPLIAIIATIFSSFALAWFFHPGNNEQNILKFVKHFGTKNKGELIKPIVNLGAIAVDYNDFDRWPGKIKDASLWSLVIPVYTTCNQNCINEMTKLHNIHKRLDKYARRLRRYIVHENTEQLPPEVLLKAHFKSLVIPKILWDQQLGEKKFAYLVDPRGQAILRYPLPLQVKDVFTDSKFLIKNSL